MIDDTIKENDAFSLGKWFEGKLCLRYYQLVLFLMAAVPCGIPFRYQPNPVFPSELAAFTGAILLILGAVFIPLREKEQEQDQIILPWAGNMWLALAAVVLMQYWTLRPPYMSEITVPGLYLLCAGLSVWALSRARESFGGEELMVALAWGLLAGALFNSGVGFDQLVDLFKNGWRLIYGNIGQKNMYGHYLAWGLAAGVWLVSQRKMPAWLFWVLATWLALSMAWCSSRSVLAYAVFWFPAGAFVAWRGEDRVRRFGLYLTAAALLIILMQFVAPLLNDLIQHLMRSKNEAPTGVDRIASNGARRLVEWKKALITFSQHPILGVGWGAYAANSVSLHSIPEFAKIQESVLFTHCHNSLLNLMAETGIVGTAPVLVGVIWVYAGLWRRWKDPVVLGAASMVTVSILHSMLEYPLWYYHLLGPFVLMLALMREGGLRLRMPEPLQFTGFAIASGLLMAMAVVGGWLYLQIYPILDPDSSGKNNQANISKLKTLHALPVLDFFADFALSNYIVASEQDMAWKLSILRPLNSIRPYPGQMADQAIMEALSGNSQRAHTLMSQAAYAYPESLAYFTTTLNRFSQPEVVALRQDVEKAQEFFAKEKAKEKAEEKS